MPRKKPEELESTPAAEPAAAPAPAPAPEISYERKMTIDNGALPASADMNGDGHISKQEMEMHLEFKRKELEDQDAMRDAQRSMAWFALFGMLLYPFAVVAASYFNLDNSATVLGSMAATYFVSVAAIVMAFFGANAYSAKGK
jgi:hypothetical protein